MELTSCEILKQLKEDIGDKSKTCINNFTKIIKSKELIDINEHFLKNCIIKERHEVMLLKQHLNDSKARLDKLQKEGDSEKAIVYVYNSALNEYIYTTANDKKKVLNYAKQQENLGRKIEELPILLDLQLDKIIENVKYLEK